MNFHVLENDLSLDSKNYPEQETISVEEQLSKTILCVKFHVKLLGALFQNYGMIGGIYLSTHASLAVAKTFRSKLE